MKKAMLLIVLLVLFTSCGSQQGEPAGFGSLGGMSAQENLMHYAKAKEMKEEGYQLLDRPVYDVLKDFEWMWSRETALFEPLMKQHYLSYTKGERASLAVHGRPLENYTNDIFLFQQVHMDPKPFDILARKYNLKLYAAIDQEGKFDRAIAVSDQPSFSILFGKNFSKEEGKFFDLIEWLRNNKESKIFYPQEKKYRDDILANAPSEYAYNYYYYTKMGDCDVIVCFYSPYTVKDSDEDAFSRQQKSQAESRKEFEEIVEILKGK